MDDSTGLVITELARTKMHYACNYDKGKEVSWFGKARIEDQHVVLEDIYIPPQEVGGAHIEITTDDLAAFWTDLISRGESPKDWPIWCHSHAGMQTSPSGTDTNTLEVLAEQFGGWAMGLVTNHRGEYTAWLALSKPFNMRADVKIHAVPVKNRKVADEIEKAMKENVHVKTWTQANNHPGSQGSGWAGGKREGSTVPFGQPRDSRTQQTPTSTTSGKGGGQEPSGSSASDNPARSSRADVIDVCQSQAYPGNVEIWFADGSFVITRDFGQMEMWQKEHKPLRGGARRRVEKIKKGGARNRKAGTQRRSIGNPRANNPLRAEVKPDDRDFIGYDDDGIPLRIGEEFELCYGVDMKPLFEGGNRPTLILPGGQVYLLPAPSDNNGKGTAVIEPRAGAKAIEMISTHGTLLKAVEAAGYNPTDEELAQLEAMSRGVVELPNGTLLDDGAVTTRAALRVKHLIPSDIHDDDIVDYLQLKECGITEAQLVKEMAAGSKR